MVNRQLLSKFSQKPPGVSMGTMPHLRDAETSLRGDGCHRLGEDIGETVIPRGSELHAVLGTGPGGK